MRRTMLFVPGNSPNLLMNFDILGADSVILDLEDAVSPAEKDSARILVRSMLQTMGDTGCEVIVRINPVDTGFWKEDLREVVKCRPSMIMPTKVGGPETVKQVADYIGDLEKEYGIPEGTVGIIPLIETALGVENAFAIAGADKSFGRFRPFFAFDVGTTALLISKTAAAGTKFGHEKPFLAKGEATS